MTKHNPKPALVNLSVEEENLAAIPFAVLERRVGKRIGKIEIKGTKVLPNGSEMEGVWQIQGNNELGLPTEQDLRYLNEELGLYLHGVGVVLGPIVKLFAQPVGCAHDGEVLRLPRSEEHTSEL